MAPWRNNRTPLKDNYHQHARQKDIHTIHALSEKKLINGYIGCSTVAFFMPCYWKCNPNVRLLVGRLVIRSVCHNFHAGIGAFVEFVPSL